MSLILKSCASQLQHVQFTSTSYARVPRRSIAVRSGCNEDLPIELQGTHASAHSCRWLSSAPVSFLRFSTHRPLKHSFCFFSSLPLFADLKITDQGLLIDEKTGEVINEYGATRFDIKMAALNGQFQPPPSVQDTERSTGLILDSLMHWPATYDFQFVLKTAQGEATSSPAEILEEMRVLVGRICSKEIEVSVCSVKERKGGKYVSVTVPAVVNGPEVIQRVFDTLEEDASFNGRILMKY